MIFKTEQHNTESYPLANLGMLYRNTVKYQTPGVPPSITESEKELRAKLFPNIWEGINEL